jgi:hypothetical protein
MRILFTSQNRTLKIFEALRSELARMRPLARCGFILADSWYYTQFQHEHPDFERQGHALLKEWEITARRYGKPDLALLARFEKELGVESLFDAIVADRRLLMGPDCAYTQDYRRRFSDNELLCILQHALVETDKLFTALEPDVVVGFICVTMLDYLAFLFARARGIRYLNLRPTRIADKMFFGSTLHDPDPHFVDTYQRILAEGSPKFAEAAAYVDSIRQSSGRYEGVVKPSAKPARRLSNINRPITALSRQTRAFMQYRNSVAATDNHVPSYLRPLFFAGVVNPHRARQQAKALAARYIAKDDIPTTDFAFFPMHAEPEVSLLVYGRPFLNQIEAIRLYAHALPIGYQLLVKEHPWMVGKRTTSYYEKLLEIPRVRLVSPAVEAKYLIQHAKLITVIASSVGLEAAMAKTPAITLGQVPFNVLPKSMLVHCRDVSAMPRVVRRLLDSHSHDEKALHAYVAAVLETSDSVQWYSTLLDRSDAHRVRETKFNDEVGNLARYTLRVLEAGPPAPVINTHGPRGALSEPTLRL